jgi:hypothetical protein
MVVIAVIPLTNPASPTVETQYLKRQDLDCVAARQSWVLCQIEFSDTVIGPRR